MKSGLHRILAAATLAFFSVWTMAQQQPAPPAEPSSGSDAPQTANPQTPTPEKEPEAPPPQQHQQVSPKQEESVPPAENASPTLGQPPSGEPKKVPKEKVAAKPAPKQHKALGSKGKKRVGRRAATPKPNNKPNADSSGQPDKVVVRNGGARDDAIRLSPGGSQEQELHNRENTQQLLSTTDENLKRLEGRQLTPSQQSTLDQIHTYVRQARAAADAGDLARAHTLAFKAHLLSDDLAKR